MKHKELARQAVIAAVYTAISLALMPITFGVVQCRIAESMMVLPFYNRKHTVGLTLGCLITNMFSPSLGMADVVFGTAATFVACLCAVWLGAHVRRRRLNAARFVWLVPAVAAAINGVIIGALLYFVLGFPFIASAISVAAGEAVAVAAGVLAMRLIVSHQRLNALVIE